MRGLIRCLAATAFVALAAGGTATAQSGDAAGGVSAVASPAAAPACVASGLETFLVAADGPVLVLCGSRAADEGTRCELTDSAVEVVWPDAVSDGGVAPPAPGGAVVDATAEVTGEEPTPVADALQCSAPVPSAGDFTPPPRPVVVVPPVSQRPAAPAPAVGSPAPAGRPAAATATAAPAPASTAAPVAAPSRPAATGVPIAALRPDGKGAVVALLALVAAAGLWHHARRPHALTPQPAAAS